MVHSKTCKDGNECQTKGPWNNLVLVFIDELFTLYFHKIKDLKHQLLHSGYGFQNKNFIRNFFIFPEKKIEQLRELETAQRLGDYIALAEDPGLEPSTDTAVQNQP